MNRVQLAHVLCAASRIAEDDGLLVVGSQSILGSRDEDELPPEATASMEVDIASFALSLVNAGLIDLDVLASASSKCPAGSTGLSLTA